MRDLEDDLRQRPTDPEQALRVNRMASLEGRPSPTYPGSGRRKYIIKFCVYQSDGQGGRTTGPTFTEQVRADTRPSKSKARQMVTEIREWAHLYPEEIKVKSVRTP